MHNHLLPIKDILEFASQPIYDPNYAYRNLLYIYPLAINLCGANSSSRAASSAAVLAAANANLTQQSAQASGVGNGVAGSGGGAGGLLTGGANSNASQSLLNSSSARNIAIKVNFMKGNYLVSSIIFDANQVNL